MKTLLVSSRVTFVPDNYAGLVSPLAEHPHVHGLMILDNLESSLMLKALGLWMFGRARDIGSQLLRNAQLSKGADPRIHSFYKAGKPVYFFEDINASETLEFLEKEKFDLIVNARTRFIYKAPVLSAARLGCINIHHGVLPQQRGVFCDLWALAEKKNPGFTIHQMTKKIDDGKILAVHEHQNYAGQEFLSYLRMSSLLEAELLSKVIHDIEKAQAIKGSENKKTPDTRYFKNPTLSDFKKFTRRGFKV